MAIELATKYSEYVDEIFKQESKREKITNKDYDFDGAHTVKVYKISTARMNNYGRTGTGNNYGTPEQLSATTETMTLTKDRSFSFVIDYLDSDETAAALKAATALARQVREVVVPEVDGYVYGKMATGAGTKIATALSADNIYGEIIAGSEALDDAEVPEEGRAIVICPAAYRMLKTANGVVLDTNLSAEQIKTGVIAMLDGMEVIKVPSSRLPEGFGFMIAHKSACVAPVKLESYNTHFNPPGINGWLVEGRICYDAFVLENKADAIYYHALAAASGSK